MGWLLSVFTLVLLVSSHAQDFSGQYHCAPERVWSLGFGNNQFPRLCYTMASVAGSYEDALDYCHRRHASLLPVYNQTDINWSGDDVLNMLATNSIPRLWYGFYISDGRLRTDKFPPTQKESPGFYVRSAFSWLNKPKEYVLSAGPPGHPDCFTQHVNRSCPVGRSNQEGALDCKRYSVHSTDCGQRFPFMCVKPPLVNGSDTFLNKREPLCQVDEVGSSKLALCYSFPAQRLNYTAAQAQCQARDPDRKKTARLYRPFSDVTTSSFMDRAIITALVNNTDGPVQNILAWVGGVGEDDGDDRRRCLALNLNTVDLMSWNCETALPFLCQRDLDYPEVASLRIQIKDRELEGSREPFRSERIHGSNDTQVWLPQVYTQEQVAEVVCSYNDSLVPQLQTMILVQRGIAIEQATSSVPVPLEVMSRFYMQTQGVAVQPPVTRVSTEVSMMLYDELLMDRIKDYYWCEINDPHTGRLHRSPRLFVRLQGEEMYAVSIAITGPPRSDLHLLSLTGREDSFEAPITSDMLSFRSFRYRVLRYRYGLVPGSSPCEVKDCPEADAVAATVVDFHFFNRTLGSDRGTPSTEALNVARRQIAATFSSIVEPIRFNVNTLQVKSIDFCPSTTVYDPVSTKTFSVDVTALGDVFTSPDVCLSDGQPYVRLVCQGDKLYGAQWSEFKPISGCHFHSEDTSVITATLKNISESDISVPTVEGVLRDTLDVVYNIDTFVPLDIVYVADILQQTSALSNVSEQNVRTMLDLVDVMSGINQTLLQESSQLGNASNRILRAIDTVSDKIPVEGDPPRVRVVSRSTGLEVWDLTNVTSSDLVVGLQLEVEGSEPTQVISPDDLMSIFNTSRPSFSSTHVAILLPAIFIRALKRDNPSKALRLSMSVFADTALFRQGQLQLTSGLLSDTARLNSKVIAAKVTVDGVPMTDLSGYSNVTTVYQPTLKLASDKEQEANSTCVFWDFQGARGQGSWSSQGCGYRRTVQARDVCVCDHLTNFAVLMDVYGQSLLPEAQQVALSVISIIGLSLSIAGLSCTVLSFICIRKLRQGRPQQTLFNMALAMLASWVIFLAGFERTESYAGCLAVAALLHYFILVSFLWMLVEGVLQYLLFIRVMGVHFHRYMWKTALPAWGLPLIPVIVVLSIDMDLYHGGDHYCWMSLPAFYYAFLAPVVAIMAVNIVVYVMVMVNICRRRNIGNSSSSNNNKRAVGIRASVACFVVLGLSWVFAFMAVEDARVVFQYLFTISTSLQGLLIFLIFTARDPAVRAFWRHALCSCCPGENTSKSSSSNNRAGKPKDRDALPARADDVTMTSPQSKSATSSSMTSDSQHANGRKSSDTSQLSTSVTSVTSGQQSDAVQF